jgi:hypothetical protein
VTLEAVDVTCVKRPSADVIVQLQPFTGTLFVPSNPADEVDVRVMLVLVAVYGIVMYDPEIVAGVAETLNDATGLVGGGVGLTSGMLVGMVFVYDS